MITDKTTSQSASWSPLSVFGEIYDASQAQSFPSDILEIVDRVIPTDVSSFNSTTVDDQQIGIHAFRPFDLIPDDDSLDVFNQTLHEHPLVRFFTKMPHPLPTRWSDTVETKEFMSTRLFNDYYRRRSTRYQVGVKLEGAGGTMVTLALSRESHDFSDEEVGRVTRLLGPIRQAHQVASLNESLAVARIGLMDEARSLVAFNDKGFVTAVEGMDIDGIVVGGHLAPQLCATLERARVGQQPVLVDVGGRRMTVRFIGTTPAGNRTVSLREVNPPPLSLADRGLTPRQIEVAISLASGGTNTQIGARLGISPATVRKHLERIYVALEVEDRAAAVATIHTFDLSTIQSEALQ